MLKVNTRLKLSCLVVCWIFGAFSLFCNARLTGIALDKCTQLLYLTQLKLVSIEAMCVFVLSQHMLKA
jgi:hypothetical protein